MTEREQIGESQCYKFTHNDGAELEELDYHSHLVGFINTFLEITEDKYIKPKEEEPSDFKTFQAIVPNETGGVKILEVVAPFNKTGALNLLDIAERPPKGTIIYPQETRDKRKKVINPVTSQENAKDFLVLMQEIVRQKIGWF